MCDIKYRNSQADLILGYSSQVYFIIIKSVRLSDTGSSRLSIYLPHCTFSVDPPCDRLLLDLAQNMYSVCTYVHEYASREWAMDTAIDFELRQVEYYSPCARRESVHVLARHSRWLMMFARTTNVTVIRVTRLPDPPHAVISRGIFFLHASKAGTNMGDPRLSLPINSHTRLVTVYFIYFFFYLLYDPQHLTFHFRRNLYFPFNI